jgi:hypothetical protein
MAIILSCDTIGSIMFLGSEKARFSSDIVFLWILPLAPAVSVTNGFTFQILTTRILLSRKFNAHCCSALGFYGVLDDRGLPP